MTLADPKDHWEALFNKQFMRWFHLNGKPALMEIVRVERNVELTLPGGAKNKKPVLHMRQVQGEIEEVKPLVLNVTNGNAIADIHGPAPSKWPGKEIVLEQGTRQLKGKEVPAIIIRAKIERKQD